MKNLSSGSVLWWVPYTLAWTTRSSWFGEPLKGMMGNTRGTWKVLWLNQSIKVKLWWEHWENPRESTQMLSCSWRGQTRSCHPLPNPGHTGHKELSRNRYIGSLWGYSQRGSLISLNEVQWWMSTYLRAWNLVVSDATIHNPSIQECSSLIALNSVKLLPLLCLAYIEVMLPSLCLEPIEIKLPSLCL